MYFLKDVAPQSTVIFPHIISHYKPYCEMQYTTSALILGLSCLSNAAPSSFSGSYNNLVPGVSHTTAVETLYLIDDLSPNHVIALPVSSNGTVSKGTSTATGGNGGAFIQRDGFTPIAADSLNGQDAVVRQGNAGLGHTKSTPSADIVCSFSTSLTLDPTQSPCSRLTRWTPHRLL